MMRDIARRSRRATTVLVLAAAVLVALPLTAAAPTARPEDVGLSTERLKRVSFGLMQVEIAVNDPKAYTKPRSVTIEMAAIVDTQMLEEICIDNEKDTKLYK